MHSKHDIYLLIHTINDIYLLIYVGLFMQTCIHTYTHIQIHSKHIMNLGLPYFGVGGVGAYDDGASIVGAHDVGAYDASAPDAGAPSVDALDASAHVIGVHNFGALGKTPMLRLMMSLFDFYEC